MLELSLIGALLISLTVVIHAFGTTYWVRFLVSRYVQENGQWYSRKSMQILIGTGLVLVGLHVIQIVLWALTYRALVPPAELATLEAAVYFSFVTFTTLGYGDITLSEGWRLLSGIEAMNGILLVGWSTAVLFAVVQRIWQGTALRNDG
jgi:voltage-gated potassium channel Kch